LILIDTSALIALFDAAEPEHERVARAIVAARPPRLVSPLVLAELDHLLSRRATFDTRVEAADELGGSGYSLAPFGAHDLLAARDVMRAFRDLDIGLTDASIVAIALRDGVRDVLTLDERHFRVVPGPGGEPFRILPADA
jgi:predicted nucleic acid-binding protein